VLWSSLGSVIESILALLPHPFEEGGSRSLVIGSVPWFPVAFLRGRTSSEHIFDDSLGLGGFNCSLFDCHVSMDWWRVQTILYHRLRQSLHEDSGSFWVSGCVTSTSGQFFEFRNVGVDIPVFHSVIREGSSGSVFFGRVEVLGFEFE
jgi:hypothetical protein